jgi:hypothetical protein
MQKLAHTFAPTLLAVGLSLAASARAADATPDPDDGYEADTAPAQAPSHDADPTERAYGLLPDSVSPRVGDQVVTGHFWGGYDGGARRPVGDAVVDGRLSRWLALRAGASSSDLWGRPTATLGVRLGILRDGAAPFDLGVGVFYLPASIRGDGLVLGVLSFGKTFGRLSSQAMFGYGQDPEGDDGFGVTSLGGTYKLTERVHIGVASRARFQLWSADSKFSSLDQPVMDLSAGPLVGYSIGRFDIIAQGGIAGLMLRSPPETTGERTSLQLGPLMMLGVSAAL